MVALLTERLLQGWLCVNRSPSRQCWLAVRCVAREPSALGPARGCHHVAGLCRAGPLVHGLCARLHVTVRQTGDNAHRLLSATISICGKLRSEKLTHKHRSCFWTSRHSRPTSYTRAYTHIPRDSSAAPEPASPGHQPGALALGCAHSRLRVGGRPLCPSLSPGQRTRPETGAGHSCSLGRAVLLLGKLPNEGRQPALAQVWF